MIALFLSSHNKLTIFWIVLLVPLLLISLGCSEDGKPTNQDQNIQKVGFDLDDTLLFSTPAFQEGFESEVRPFSDQFWSIVNESDRGNSCVKPRTVEILKKHRSRDRSIFVITARSPHNTSPAKSFLENRFSLKPKNIYFKPDGKAELIRKLKLDLYYGDSDSDIKAARKAGIKGIRIQRSPKSDYEDKYNPGKFDEKIISNSKNHNCQL